MSFGFVIILLLAFAGLPLFLILSLLGISGYISEGLDPAIYFSELMRLASNHTLTAIPLFTVAGYLLAESKASERIIRLTQSGFGKIPGGLAVLTLVTMAIFTAFTGASGITIVALGGLLFPTLLKSGYKERFSLGLLTSSGSIGLLFPPSLPIIIYGVVAEVSINKMFIGGLVPGILLVSGVSLYAVLMNRTHEKVKISYEPFLPALRDAAWELALPIVVIGGIYGGVFTATEAAAVSAGYLLIVECFIIRDIHPIRDLPRVLSESAIMIGAILLILGSALALINYLIYAEIPMIILEWVKSVISSRVMFLISVNIFLLIVGCLMDIFSALMVIVPLVLPMAIAYDVHPIHFGIIFLVNLEIGYSTPPVGLNLFIASHRFRQPILKLYRATLPFLIIQLIILLIITYVPELVLYPIELFSK